MGQSLLFHDKWIYNVEKLQKWFSFMYYIAQIVWAYDLTNNKKERNTEISFYIFFFFIIAVCRQLACANRVLK